MVELAGYRGPGANDIWYSTFNNLASSVSLYLIIPGKAIKIKHCYCDCATCYAYDRQTESRCRGPNLYKFHDTNPQAV